jgi:hypothetical protein
MNRGSLSIALVVLCALGNAACGGSSHHVTPPIATNNFVFYAAGTDSTGLTYSIVGVVQITADGKNTIMGGVQDFNDGNSDTGIGTSPQPGGDTISAAGSSLSFNPDGSGNALLTLATSNLSLGVKGVEEFALSFANPSHALIAQFDNTATSLGSYDLQTLPTAALAGTSFSVTTSGVDSTGAPIVEGGVLALDGSGTVTGSVDINDGGHVTFANSPTEGTSIPRSDTFGRGTVTGSIDGTTAVVNYYVVNSEVLRLIDVDKTDTAVGSAYGQGTAAGTFSPTSIGQSAFSISGVDHLVLYAGAGEFSTSAVEDGAKPKSNARPVRPQGNLPACTGTPCNFNGFADVNESLIDGGDIVTAQPFSGSYVMATTGYGSFTFGVEDGPVPDMKLFGVYAVDPKLNILDPNNSGENLTGGALIAELDTNLVGTGLLIPQSSTDLTTLAADVVFAAQGHAAVEDSVAEFDLLGASAVAAGSGTIAGEGFIDDPAGILTGAAIVDLNSVFNGTFTDDGRGIGRSTTGAGGFIATDNGGTGIEFTVTAYEANGNQLFWVETDSDKTFAGSIQASTFTVPVPSKVPAKPKNK